MIAPRALTAAAALLLLATPGLAHAYMGPGLGMGFLGAVFGVIGSIFLGIAAIVWYPIKRLLRRMKRRREESEDTPES